MKKKIFLYYMISTIIVVSIICFLFSRLAQEYYIYEVKEKLKTTADLIKYQISESMSGNAGTDYDRIAGQYSEILNASAVKDHSPEEADTRITIVDFKGNVLGESEANYRSMDNHLDRKEIKEAVSGKTGEDIRYSKTLKIDFLYVAIPVESLKLVIRVSVPLHNLDRIIKTIRLYAIMFICLGLVLSVLAAFRFTSSVIRPVKELISVSRDISNGNYIKRVSAKSNDELGQLALTFNEMASKLEKTVAELTDKNAKLDTIINSIINGIVAVDIRYRIIFINAVACEMFGINKEQDHIGTNMLELIRNNQINNSLKETIEKNIPLSGEIVISPPTDRIYRYNTNPIRSKDMAAANSGGIAFIQDVTNIRKLEQIRTEFVSNVSHELKTPLTSIRGFIETLRNGAIDDRETAKKFMEIIDIEAERLYMLINDILQLSEIETRQKDINIDSFELKPVVYEILSMLQVAANRKSLAISVDIDAGIKITANRDKIKQMLINLIDNAIKYNVDNGRIGIKAFRNEGKITILIRDTGIGISQEHLSRIFERFYRVDRGRSRSMGGTGLGLSIVKHIVNLYNGDIKVNSEPGKGSEFVIQLPV